MKMKITINQLAERDFKTSSSFVFDSEKPDWVFDDGEVIDGVSKIYENEFWLQIVPKALTGLTLYQYNWSPSTQDDTIKAIYKQIAGGDLSERSDADQDRIYSIIMDNVYEQLDLDNDPHCITGIYLSPVEESTAYYKNPKHGG